MKNLEKRIDILEKKISILEETLETIKKMQISEQMDSYIKKKTRTLNFVDLLNSVSDEQIVDIEQEYNKVEKVRKTKTDIDKEIDEASNSSKNFEEGSCNVEYFDYEIENGIETDPYGRGNLENNDMSKFVGKGIRITAYKGFEQKKIIIPHEIDGLPVICIGERTFMNAPISDVVLPETLKVIMRSAFEGCECLKYIHLPEKLEILRRDCFAKSGLEEINIPDNVKAIPNHCFSLCKNLKKINIGKQVASIGSWAFWGTGITTLIIPEQVKTVAYDIFKDSAVATYEKSDITCVFLGEKTDLRIPDYRNFYKVGTIYCLPGSHVQITAREHNIQIKPLREFRWEA